MRQEFDKSMVTLRLATLALSVTQLGVMPMQTGLMLCNETGMVPWYIWHRVVWVAQGSFAQ
jgi:hypothetical protein